MTASLTKKSTLLKLISRPKGANIDALTKATGWQAHSVRAGLTGLRKDGHKVERIKNHKGYRAYRIVGED